MSNNEKIKPIALAIVELCWSEGISQSGRQLINRAKTIMDFSIQVLFIVNNQILTDTCYLI